MAAGIDRERALARLDEIREAIGVRPDEPSEVLIRRQRDERTRKLAGEP